MNSEHTVLSLEILLLNDLLREGVIDLPLYNMASDKIVSFKSNDEKAVA